MFEKEAYNKFLIENNVVGFFDKPITLKSGRVSNWYVNMRNLTNNVNIKNKLVNFVLAFVRYKDWEPDLFYGVPEGATKLGLFLTDAHAKIVGRNLPLVMGRGRPKAHGEAKDRFFVGDIPDKSKVIIIEDVTTTGGSLLATIENLQRINVEIIAAVGLVNRLELSRDGKSVEENVNEKGVDYFAISNAFELLPLAADRAKPDDKTLAAVEDYFQKYGVKQLKLK